AVRIRARAEHDDRVRRPELRGTLHGERGPVPQRSERGAEDEHAHNTEDARSEGQASIKGSGRHGSAPQCIAPAPSAFLTRGALRRELKRSSVEQYEPST